ncbi:hypothetical protein ACKLKD_17785 [Klebsiella sp. 10982]|jgi:hypothetical protein|uniref:Uncharacterized protein n=2 Tax=Klebsiella quasivariicola TaxID=2026240 RepID=A0A223UDI2_9ENTR|nr:MULTISPECIES: hypothetical protein [Klebsiella]MEA1148067.1 hypothetical protein [Klebsiella pneumoniae]QBL50128.1 hypothetical protein BMD99_017215 [Klebsiella sp. PO552]ASV21070.1 hypothetical protein B8P98_18125 [Klebsiella quasivariicola]MBF7821319.1 hypothetical protein [Klebsiella quasivariicola]MBK2374512.1 hypothetical protein [Klebsiella quasivariicola]
MSDSWMIYSSVNYELTKTEACTIRAYLLKNYLRYLLKDNIQKTKTMKWFKVDDKCKFARRFNIVMSISIFLSFIMFFMLLGYSVESVLAFLIVFPAVIFIFKKYKYRLQDFCYKTYSARCIKYRKFTLRCLTIIRANGLIKISMHSLRRTKSVELNNIDGLGKIVTSAGKMQYFECSTLRVVADVGDVIFYGVIDRDNGNFYILPIPVRYHSRFARVITGNHNTL